MTTTAPRRFFYFTPHKKWYLVYQMGVPGATKMWVAYSTTAEIADPDNPVICRHVHCVAYNPADIARPEAHTMLFNPQYESANMIIQDGVILASHYVPASPYATGFIISLDTGRTWAQYDLKEYGRRSPVRFHKKNSDGWFRVDLRSGWIKRAEVLFIKPKHAFSSFRLG